MRPSESSAPRSLSAWRIPVTIDPSSFFALYVNCGMGG